MKINAADGKRNLLTSHGNEAKPFCAAGKRLGDIAAKPSKIKVISNFFIWMFMITL